MRGAAMQRRVVHVRNVDDYPNSWAQLVQELIDRPGWSQQRLADESGIDRGTIRRWRTGESANVSAGTVRLIADAAGIDQDIAARAAVGAQDAAKDDEIVREVEAAKNIDEGYRRQIIDMIHRKRAEAEASLRRDIRLMLQRPPEEQAS